MIQIYLEDIKRWVNQGNFLVLQYCAGWNEDCWDMLFEEKEKLIEYLVEPITNCEMWFDPETGEQIFLCPFLRKERDKNGFECMIHDSKPLMCRDYVCDPKDIKGIIKRPFEENLKDYRKRRKQYPSVLKYVARFLPRTSNVKRRWWRLNPLFVTKICLSEREPFPRSRFSIPK